ILIKCSASASPNSAEPEDSAPDSPQAVENDDHADPGAYEEALAPYGSWIDDPEFGRVWHPTVAYGWRPYVDGNWSWSPYGWTWISPEPWGWTFHYGRWAFQPASGWVWVPDDQWGPAWVDWFYGDDFVGWAPLPASANRVTTIQNY